MGYYHYVLPLLVMMILGVVGLQLTNEPKFQHAFWFIFGSAAFLALVMTFGKLLQDGRL